MDLTPQSQIVEIGANQFIAVGVSPADDRPQPVAQNSSDAPQLISELGCANCHSDLNLPAAHNDHIPDLSRAGLRYNPAYLFDFLQAPVKIRRHIGAARMPDFHFSEAEALALSRYLETRRQLPEKISQLPSEIRSADTPGEVADAEKTAALIRGEKICLTCHTLSGEGGVLAVDLATVSYRLRPEWVRQYLANPALYDVPAAVMPAQFYQAANNGETLAEMTPNAANQILEITDYLFSLNSDKGQQLSARYQDALTKYPRATADVGEKVYRSQQCFACHRDAEFPSGGVAAAPDLGSEGIRVLENWLRNYLKAPVALRPFGSHPGNGARMPDFRLSGAEADMLTTFLMQQRENQSLLSATFQKKTPTAFSAKKTQALLSDKLSCLGCHLLGEFGGKIGPDLSNTGGRLQPAYVYSIIKNPRAIAPHSIMPDMFLSDETAEVLANFLLHQKTEKAAAPYLSLIENNLILPEKHAADSGDAAVKSMYQTHCAACHGSDGQADGYNAKYLPVVPTRHADSEYMKNRPDDTLYDGIHAGGYILNKSHFMPAWGGMLSDADIRKLVAFMRTLCNCREPAWSRDNRKN